MKTAEQKNTSYNLTFYIIAEEFNTPDTCEKLKKITNGLSVDNAMLATELTDKFEDLHKDTKWGEKDSLEYLPTIYSFIETEIHNRSKVIRVEVTKTFQVNMTAHEYESYRGKELMHVKINTTIKPVQEVK